MNTLLKRLAILALTLIPFLPQNSSAKNWADIFYTPNKPSSSVVRINNISDLPLGVKLYSFADLYNTDSPSYYLKLNLTRNITSNTDKPSPFNLRAELAGFSEPLSVFRVGGQMDLGENPSLSVKFLPLIYDLKGRLLDPKILGVSAGYRYKNIESSCFAEVLTNEKKPGFSYGEISIQYNITNSFRSGFGYRLFNNPNHPLSFVPEPTFFVSASLNL